MGERLRPVSRRDALKRTLIGDVVAGTAIGVYLRSAVSTAPVVEAGPPETTVKPTPTGEA